MSLDENNIEANYNLGLVHYNLKDYEKSLHHLERAVFKDLSSFKKQQLYCKQFGQCYFNMGLVQEQLKLKSEACDSYIKAIQKGLVKQAATNLALL